MARALGLSPRNELRNTERLAVDFLLPQMHQNILTPTISDDDDEIIPTPMTMELLNLYTKATRVVVQPD